MEAAVVASFPTTRVTQEEITTGVGEKRAFACPICLEPFAVAQEVGVKNKRTPVCVGGEGGGHVG